VNIFPQHLAKQLNNKDKPDLICASPCLTCKLFNQYTIHHTPYTTKLLLNMDMSTQWQHQRRINTPESMTQHSRHTDDQLYLSDFSVYGHLSLDMSFYDLPSVQPFGPAWSQQNQPLERFMREDGPLVISSSFPMQNRFQATNIEGVSSLPRATHRRMISPAPSQEQSSYCSSAHSPGADRDWYQKKNNNSPACYSPQSIAQDAPSLGHSNGGSQPSMDLQPLDRDNFTFAPNHYHQSSSFPVYPSDNMNSQEGISLNQVQSFVDHQESQEVSNEDGHYGFDHAENGYHYFKGSNAPGGVYATPDQMRAT